jgi:hypothetical protein
MTVYELDSMMTHYDVIIIGTGAGGGTLAHRLAATGKRILLLERGPFLPCEKENWDTKTVFNTNRYHNDEVWYDREGKELHPGMSYFVVVGNTKVYGAALSRLRAIQRQRRQKMLSLCRGEVRSRLMAAYHRGRNSQFAPDAWQPETLWEQSLVNVQLLFGLHSLTPDKPTWSS